MANFAEVGLFSFMELNFTKYQGTGNDFVLIDNRTGIFPKENLDLVRRLCDRRFGIGADGLMLIENSKEEDFNMIYFNSDGSKSLCGNGSRCSIHFAHSLGIIPYQTSFITTDGAHKAFLKDGWVHFQLHDIDQVSEDGNDFFVENGSPHHVRFVEDVEGFDVFTNGEAIRYSEKYQPGGTNVNFVEMTPSGIKVRTYERGVENETLSCGTGVTAAAIVAAIKGKTSPVQVNTKGGDLEVSFEKEGNTFKNVFLAGPATPVFKGRIEI